MATTEPTTALDALIAELHCDVLSVHDSIKALPGAINAAVEGALKKLEKCAEAQTCFIEQETLKNHTALLQQQRDQDDAAHKAMEALIAVQNAALESILVRVGGLMAAAVRKEVRAAFEEAGPRASTTDASTARAIWAAASALGVVALVVAAGALAVYLK